MLVKDTEVGQAGHFAKIRTTSGRQVLGPLHYSSLRRFRLKARIVCCVTLFGDATDLGRCATWDHVAENRPKDTSTDGSETWYCRLQDNEKHIHRILMSLSECTIKW